MHDVRFYLRIRVPGPEPFPHDHAQIVREGRIGIVDSLILADEAAKFLTDGAGSRLQPRIGKLLAWEHGERGRRKGNCRKQAENKLNQDSMRPWWGGSRFVDEIREILASRVPAGNSET